jgi:hypothetical protein|tara:strand:- start:93 stop:257 length:165 start_codon:yes stop_codon:yes gene_type:complete
MGTQKRRFVVERLKKAKQEDSKESDEAFNRELDKLDKDGKFHLLLLKQIPYLRV